MKNLPVLIKKEGGKAVWLAQPKLDQTNARLYASWLNDSRVVSGIGSVEKVSEQEAYELLKGWQEEFLKLHWFVHFYEKGGMIPVGDLNLNIIREKNAGNFPEFTSQKEFSTYEANAEIAVMISGEYQGRGIGKLAVQRSLEYIVENKKFDSIWASIYKENEPSLKLFSNQGFKIIAPYVEERSGREEWILRLGKN